MRPCCVVYVPTEIRVELGFLHSRKFFLLASHPLFHVGVWRFARPYNWAGGTSLSAARKACEYLDVSRGKAAHILQALIIHGLECMIAELRLGMAHDTYIVGIVNCLLVVAG